MTRRVLLLLCVLASSPSAFAQTWSTVPLATRDLAYSPLTQRLYATTPANNSVQEIDPFSGALLRSLFVGSQPNKLAMSDTGSHLYVGLDDDPRLIDRVAANLAHKVAIDDDRQDVDID